MIINPAELYWNHAVLTKSTKVLSNDRIYFESPKESTKQYSIKGFNTKLDQLWAA